jgi:glycosyltransferase involved in cell wall biosynthesis
MRVLMVSSLFPTTVVTGGTQVPVAQALALRELGHDVQLFGGYISHMPGQAIRATEVSGFPARLVDVAGRLDPEAPEFFVNPEAQRQFSTMLGGGFDVVHFHSLQGLGSAMVSMARARGVRTAVQMHDFFWVCDRQFLVTKDLRPCSGPGGLGCVCPVSQDKPSRMAALAQADALLVPTDEMRRWLSNLGFDEGRLQVGGWPSPDLPPPAPHTQWDTSTPYVLYLGGLSSEKGWPTLLKAASGDDAASIRVLCPGIPERAIPGELHSRLVGGPVATRAEIALLMSHAHGVIVPSIAAETFSYVAREALSLGVPAVITDGPGGVDCWRTSPDSVILLPRGRSDHLRTAMVELLGREPPNRPVPLSSPTDLGHQLVDIYSAIGRGQDRDR